MQCERYAGQQLSHSYRLAMGTERTMLMDVVTVEHAFVETSEIDISFYIQNPSKPISIYFQALTGFWCAHV